MPSLTTVQQNQPDTGRGRSRGSPHVNKKRWVNRFKQNLKLKMKTKPKEQLVPAFTVKSASDGQTETKPHSPDSSVTSSSDEFTATSSEDEQFDQASTVTLAELDEPKLNVAEQTKLSRDDVDDKADEDASNKQLRMKLIAGLHSVEKGGSLINKWKELSDEFQRRYVISNSSDKEALSSTEPHCERDRKIKVNKLVNVEERFGNLSRVIGGRFQSNSDITTLSAKEFSDSPSATTQLESDNTVELELAKNYPFPVGSGELYDGYFDSNRLVASNRQIIQQNVPRDSTTTSGSVRTLSTSDDESLPSFTSTLNMQLLTRPASRYGSAMTSPSYQSTCAVKMSDKHPTEHGTFATEAFRRQCLQVLQKNSPLDCGFKTVVQVAPPSAFSYTKVRNANNIVSVAVNGEAASSFHDTILAHDARQSQTVPRFVQHGGSQGHGSIGHGSVSMGCHQQTSTTNRAVPDIISMLKDQTLNLIFFCQNSNQSNCSQQRNHDIRPSSFVDDEVSTYTQLSATLDFDDSSHMTSCDDAVVQQVTQMTSSSADNDMATLQDRDGDDDDEITLHETITVEEIDERVIIEIREDLEFRLMKTTQPLGEAASSDRQPKTTVYTALVDRRKQKTTRTEETKNKDSDLTSTESVIASSDSTEVERKFDRDTAASPVSSRDQRLQIQTDDHSSTSSTITSPTCNWDDKSSIELLTVGRDNTHLFSQYEPENVYFRFTERPKLLSQQQRQLQQQQQNTTNSNGCNEHLARTSFCGQEPAPATVPVLKSTC